MSKGGGGNVQMPKPEDYFPLIQKTIDTNRIDQTTPWGGVNYSYENTPQSYDDWSVGSPGTSGAGRWNTTNTKEEESRRWIPGTNTAPNQAGYDSYLGSFDKGRQSVDAFLSPELQSMFDKQFDPNAFDNYSDDYMTRYNELLEPGRTRQQDSFEQRMFNRGLPEGGQIYGDNYRTTVGDPNARQDTMAAGMAANTAERARLEDFNRLAAAMGMTGVQYPQVDTMGPANMALNANMVNAQNSAQGSSDIWNTIAGLGAAYIGGKPPTTGGEFWA